MKDRKKGLTYVQLCFGRRGEREKAKINAQRMSEEVPELRKDSSCRANKKSSLKPRVFKLRNRDNKILREYFADESVH